MPGAPDMTCICTTSSTGTPPLEGWTAEGTKVDVNAHKHRFITMMVFVSSQGKRVREQCAWCDVSVMDVLSCFESRTPLPPSQVGYFQHYHSSRWLRVAAWSPHMIATIADSGPLRVWIRRLDGTYVAETNVDIATECSRKDDTKEKQTGTHVFEDATLHWSDGLQAMHQPCLHVCTKPAATNASAHGPSCSVVFTGMQSQRGETDVPAATCANAESDAIALGQDMACHTHHMSQAISAAPVALPKPLPFLPCHP